MKNPAKKIILIVLAILVLLMPAHLLANQQLLGSKTSTVEPKSISGTPDLADIIPLATELSGRFAKLETTLKGNLDVSAIEKEYAGITTDLTEVDRQLQQLRSSDNYSSVKIAVLKQRVADKRYLLEKVSKPLKAAINRLDGWKTGWQTEKAHWTDWQSSLLKDQVPAQLKTAFTKANSTIDSALNLVLQHLDTMLTVQAKGGDIAGRLDTFDAQLNTFISDTRQDFLLVQSPPMFSLSYLSQFKSELWITVLGSMRQVSFADSSFFAQHGWGLFLELIFFLVVFGVIHKNREALKETKNWKFLVERPVSASFFIVILTVGLFLAYLPSSVTLRLAYVTIGGIACGRLLWKVITQPWRRQAVYSVMTVFIVTEVLVTVSLPLPLTRLYILLVSLTALFFFVRWARECSSQKEPRFYHWLLRAGCGLAVFIIIAEIFGEVGIAEYLFKSTIQSMALTLPYLLFINMIYGGLHWVFFSSPVWQIKLLRNDAASLVRKVGFLFVAAIVGFSLLPSILAAWDLYDSTMEATSSILSLGFNIGTLRISVGMLIASVGTFYVALLIARVLPKVLLDEAITGHKIQRGVQLSVSRLIQYCIIFIGFLLAFTALGFDFTKFTIILSALGVGIGFGLQGIVNNFVCGLILLFERPLREGDTIEIGEQKAQIKKIGLRATIVETFEQADVIIPNADLISNQVTNWTLANRQVRLSVPVGVAYGSDVPLVVDTLLSCAKAQEAVAKTPAPMVLFLNLGESSLDFELRVWIQDVDKRLHIISDIYHEIERTFRKADITIPFPQRDLHLRDSETTSISLTPETAG